MRISLNGSDWRFKDYYGEDWHWRDAHKPATHDVHHWHTGSVPGSVHHDLWMAGQTPDPYFERNSLLLEWIPARTWLYKKTFTFGEELRGHRVQLRFGGVDYEAQFFLNGERLGEHRGMYTPAVFEVSQYLNYGGENLVAVVIEPAPHEQPQVGRTSKVRHHKSRMTYWWDFCPRMIHVGIWDEVALNVTGAARIDDVFVRPQPRADLTCAEIAVATTIDGLDPHNVEVETRIKSGDAVIAAERIHAELGAGPTSLDTTFKLDTPELWWPNGYGHQPLYEAEIVVRVDGAVSDQHSVRFGIRQVEVIANEGADPDARPYTLVVNGRKLYIKGWNWVPIDVMYGVPRPEKLDHLLGLAQRAHVNMLRVWGGGLIEKETFYHRCDELGIMVWQEFIQSSSGLENTPSDDPAFIGMMVREAEQIVPRKRNHPSLVLWCGGNELAYASEKPLDDNHPLTAALKETVTRLDPDRTWLPTSPTGRLFMNSLDNIAGDPGGLHDAHGPWEYQGLVRHYELYNAGTSLLHSEFGVEGLTNLKALTATIAPEHRWPASLDNPIYRHLGAWWNWHVRWQEFFGEMGDIVTLQRATQLMQAEGLRYAVEANRRRKYRNSGSLPWQLNEPYPNATCTSAVDYYGQAKPVYYAVARAYQPLHVSARYPTLVWAKRDRFEAEVWVHNSHEVPVEDAVVAMYLMGVNGHIYWESIASGTVAANGATRLAAIEHPLSEVEDVFFLDLLLSSQSHTAHNCYVFTRSSTLEPLLAVPQTELSISTDKHGNEWTVTIKNAGNRHTAMFVWLEDARQAGARGYALFSDNYFCLAPGEEKPVSVIWNHIPEADHRLSIGGWNTEAKIIS